LRFFAVASAVCGSALNIHQLIIARSIQGIGAALLVPGSLAIISVAFDEKSRGARLYMVGFYRNHNRYRAGSWRLAG